MLNHYTTEITGPLETWIMHLNFLHFYTVFWGVYSFLYCQNPYSHMNVFTKIQSNIAIWQYIVIHSNTIRNMALTRPLLAIYCMKLYEIIVALTGRCETLWNERSNSRR